MYVLYVLESITLHNTYVHAVLYCTLESACVHVRSPYINSASMYSDQYVCTCTYIRRDGTYDASCAWLPSWYVRGHWRNPITGKSGLLAI